MQLKLNHWILHLWLNDAFSIPTKDCVLGMSLSKETLEQNFLVQLFFTAGTGKPLCISERLDKAARRRKVWNFTLSPLALNKWHKINDWWIFGNIFYALPQVHKLSLQHAQGHAFFFFLRKHVYIGFIYLKQQLYFICALKFKSDSDLRREKKYLSLKYFTWNWIALAR